MKFKLILFIYFLFASSMAFSQLEADTISQEQRENWYKYFTSYHFYTRKYSDAWWNIAMLCKFTYEDFPHINWADTLLLYTLTQRNSYQDILYPENRSGYYLFYKTPNQKYRVLFSREIDTKILYDKEIENIFPYYTSKRDSILEDYNKLSEHLFPDTNNKAYTVDLLFENIALFYGLEPIDGMLWYPFIHHKIESCGEDCWGIGGYDKIIEVVTPNEYPHLAELLSIILLITNDTDEMPVQIRQKE